MLTVDLARLGVVAGDRVLDLAGGPGRHAFELYRRGAHVTAVGRDADDLAGVAALLDAMDDAGEAPIGARATVVEAEAAALPFDDATFAHAVVTGVLELVPDDEAAIAELVRVLRPGGTVAVAVPRWTPERLRRAIADEARHGRFEPVRIYRASDLAAKLYRAGVVGTGYDHAHALQTPGWLLRAAVGARRNPRAAAAAYGRFLERGPGLARAADRALNPVLGREVVLYGRKPMDAPL